MSLPPAHDDSTQPQAALRGQLQSVAAQLAASEARYAALVAAVPAFLYAADPAGTSQFISQNFYTYTGITSGRNPSQDWIDALHPDDRARIGELWNACVTTGTPFDTEYRFRRHDGVYRWFRGRTNPERDANGQIVRWFGAAVDVDDQYQAIDQLTRLQRLTHALAAALTPQQVATIIVNALPELIGAAASVVRVLDRSGTRLEELATNGTIQSQWNAWRSIKLDAGIPVTDVIQGREGLYFPSQDALLHQYPMLRAPITALGHGAFVALPLLVEGRALGALGITFAQPRTFTASDRAFLETVTQQCAQALDRAQLYESQQLLREAAERAIHRTDRLQAMTAALVETLLPAQVVDVVLSESLAAIGGVSGAVAVLNDDASHFDVIGWIGFENDTLTWRRFAPDAAIPIAEAVAKQQPVFLEDLEAWKQRYPTTFDDAVAAGYRAFVAVPLNASGRVIGGLNINFAHPRTFSDEDRLFLITIAHQCAQALERARLFESETRARAAAETAVFVREQFLSIAAHELRTPLTSLLGNAQLALRRVIREYPEDERNARALNVVITQAERLSRMVTELLDISRIEGNRLTMVRTVFDLRAVAEQVIASQRTLAPLYILQLTQPATPVVINADMARITQVLRNLIENAIKYSDEGQTIDVALVSDGTHALLHIRDQGAGIADEALPSLFSRFYRAEQADQERVGGLGISLYIAQQIALLHGGRITVENNQGQGSTFTLLLPLHQTTN